MRAQDKLQKVDAEMGRLQAERAHTADKVVALQLQLRELKVQARAGTPGRPLESGALMMEIDGDADDPSANGAAAP
eukprot:3708459-Alexandrium_andersonii.AAC.1